MGKVFGFSLSLGILLMLSACASNKTIMKGNDLINVKNMTIDLSVDPDWMTKAGDLQLSAPIIGDKVAILETSQGVIKFKFLLSEAPINAKNWEKLANSGYYDGTIFHRVITNFMIQGGDPTGTGRGGASFDKKVLKDELGQVLKYERGAVAMANTGQKDSAGSQFFIMHKDYPLPNLYTIFGQVFAGQNVVDAIATTKTGVNDRPDQEIKIIKARVYRVSNVR